MGFVPFPNPISESDFPGSFTDYELSTSGLPDLPNLAIWPAREISSTDPQYIHFFKPIVYNNFLNQETPLANGHDEQRRVHFIFTIVSEITSETLYVSGLTTEYNGNVQLTYTWSDLPTVIMSPIQSFVLTLRGMQCTQEIYPVNISNRNASLTSVIPIIENYNSTASTLRDLHDELVVARDDFSDAAVYKLSLNSGQERTITLAACYITKDGMLHQMYIPKNGVFTLQLTFGLSYYIA